jgi:hypothetical protein
MSVTAGCNLNKKRQVIVSKLEKRIDKCFTILTHEATEILYKNWIFCHRIYKAEDLGAVLQEFQSKVILSKTFRL